MKNKIRVSLGILSATVLGVFLWSGQTQSTLSPAEKSALPQTQVIPNSTPEIKTAIPSAITSQQTRKEQAQEPMPLDPIARIKAIQEKTALHQALIKDHAKFTRYPANNSRFLGIEQDPIEKRYRIDERTTHSDEHHVALTVWSDQKFYLHGDQAKVFATLQNEDGARLATNFFGQLIYNETKNLGIFEFRDSDQDGIYELTISLDQEEEISRVPGIYKVLIGNKTNDLIDSVAFVLSEPEAQLTGEYRDRISNEGHLIIEAEITVKQANRYSLEGSLYSSTSDPIGQTQYARDLAPGTHWIPLQFFGLMIHDAQEPGPYLLKNLSLAKVAMPMERTPLVQPEYYTKGYLLEDFSSDAFEQGMN